VHPCRRRFCFLAAEELTAKSPIANHVWTLEEIIGLIKTQWSFSRKIDAQNPKHGIKLLNRKKGSLFRGIKKKLGF
jgi:hypothetical protein